MSVAADRRHGPAILPVARGPVSAELVAAGDPLTDEDLQLTLFLCYELRYLAAVPAPTPAPDSLPAVA